MSTAGDDPTYRRLLVEPESINLPACCIIHQRYLAAKKKVFKLITKVAVGCKSSSDWRMMALAGPVCPTKAPSK